MIGVVVLSGPFAGMHGLDAQRSPSLLPLGDRPALQHIVESLVTQGITSIELIVDHGPERVEALLGNGDRWGCAFRYHLPAQSDRPYRSLKIIQDLSTEPWVLIHAEQYPCVEFSAPDPKKAVLYYGNFHNSSDSSSAAPAPESAWGGTALLPPMVITEEIANYTFDELRAYLEQLVATNEASVMSTTDWLDVSTPSRLLNSQNALLDKKLRGLLISGTERSSGIWVSRNATIHPSVTLIPPLYIGTNTRLSKGVKIGPYAVVGADCIVDTNTVIDNSLIFEGSYVGEALEVHKAIVAHNLLVNVRLDASVDISENFLLGRLDRPNRRTMIGTAFQSVFALVLLIVFLPVFLISTIYWLIRGVTFKTIEIVELPVDDKPGALSTCPLLCVGADAWSIPRSAGWSAFLRQFLPGLFAVAAGKMNLVGMPPRTIKETEALPEDWRAIYLRGKSGLITEAGTTSTDVSDEMQLYLADAYYSVQQSLSHDFMLALRYFGRLIVPMRKQGESSAAL
jgi:NDP-sugar pyrophosphorylase family protein